MAIPHSFAVLFGLMIGRRFQDRSLKGEIVKSLLLLGTTLLGGAIAGGFFMWREVAVMAEDIANGKQQDAMFQQFTNQRLDDLNDKMNNISNTLIAIRGPVLSITKQQKKSIDDQKHSFWSH